VEAEALLLQVTDDQPELAGPWINLAQVFLIQEREEHAVAALEQAVLANPGNCAARTDLGVLLRRRGEFDAAESHYLACLEYQPDFQAAYLNLGILYDLYLGRLNEALAAYRQYQALAANPDGQVNGWVVDLERRLGS
jgi:Flp pilus assembly protein TadD